MDPGRFPVYRLIDGQVMYQLRPGDRWSLVEDAVAARMLRMFDGTPLDAVGTERLHVANRERDEAGRGAAPHFRANARHNMR
ncbi:MAG TPA: hypothetical protein VIZ90_00780 [Rhizobiaceae bacterium]